jgi:hypothetical protein
MDVCPFQCELQSQHRLLAVLGLHQPPLQGQPQKTRTQMLQQQTAPLDHLLHQQVAQPEAYGMRKTNERKTNTKMHTLMIPSWTK